jgi:hypothetical protein
MAGDAERTVVVSTKYLHGFVRFVDLDHASDEFATPIDGGPPMFQHGLGGLQVLVPGPIQTKETADDIFIECGS